MCCLLQKTWKNSNKMKLVLIVDRMFRFVLFFVFLTKLLDFCCTFLKLFCDQLFKHVFLNFFIFLTNLLDLFQLFLKHIKNTKKTNKKKRKYKTKKQYNANTKQYKKQHTKNKTYFYTIIAHHYAYMV